MTTNPVMIRSIPPLVSLSLRKIWQVLSRKTGFKRAIPTALGIVLLPYLKNGNECISVLHVGARSLNFTKQKQTKLFFYRLSKNKYIALKAVPDTQ